MDDGKKAEMLRVLIGDTKHKETTEVLSAYLDMAGAKILERLYPFRESVVVDGEETLPDRYRIVPMKYEMLQLKIAAYMMNKRGAEGQIQHIENGVHRNYGDSDVPGTMLESIAPYVGIPDGR